MNSMQQYTNLLILETVKKITLKHTVYDRLMSFADFKCNTSSVFRVYM